ncbi:MAG TPA: hypothetical protein VGM96_08005 [Reyranella sp.]|jgi:hypothetical protein
MSNLPVAALVLVLSLVSVPAFAASTSVADNSAVPYCTGNAAMARRAQLAAELQLDRQLSPTIDVWNNCLKVSYSDVNGHVVTIFYDPDTLRPVRGWN